MSGLFYWDTSTVVKLHASEPDSPAYRALMKARKERPVTSFLHRVELFYALRNNEDRGEIVAGAAARLFSTYNSIRRMVGSTRFPGVSMWWMRRGMPSSRASHRLRP